MLLSARSVMKHKRNIPVTGGVVEAQTIPELLERGVDNERKTLEIR